MLLDEVQQAPPVAEAELVVALRSWLSPNNNLGISPDAKILIAINLRSDALHRRGVTMYLI
jgi:hypothetical protein